MENGARRIVLLTDFGTKDGSSACLHGVISSINPSASIIDMSHDIPGWSVSVAALFLEVYCEYYPEGTIFLTVVDPGVGTNRSILLADCEKYKFIGPSNGVFSLIFKKFPPKKVVVLSNSDYWLPNVSSTFHGRDIMAPVAAHLSNHTAVEKFGSEIQARSIPQLAPLTSKDGDKLRTKVVYVDAWGNLLLGIKKSQFENIPLPNSTLEVNGNYVTSNAKTFADIPQNQAALLFGGEFGEYGTVAMNMGNAAEKLAAKEGDNVLIY